MSPRIARACSDPQMLSVRDLTVYRHVPICRLCAFSLKDLTSVLHDLYQGRPPCREEDTKTPAPTHSVHAMTPSNNPAIRHFLPMYTTLSSNPYPVPSHQDPSPPLARSFSSNFLLAVKIISSLLRCSSACRSLLFCDQAFPAALFEAASVLVVMEEDVARSAGDDEESFEARL